MPVKAMLAEYIPDILVDHRKKLVALVIVATCGLAVFLPGLAADPTLKSGVDTTSQAYLEYQRYLEIFGNEEFFLIAVKNDRPADSTVLRSLTIMTERLGELDKITEVVSLSSIRILQEKKGLFGAYPVVSESHGSLQLPPKAALDKFRTSLPILDLLISRDNKTMGILVRMDDQWRFDLPVIEALVEEIRAIVDGNLPEGSQYRIVGAPMIRVAIQRYNFQTAIIFGTLCLLISTVVSLYIFKSLRVAGIAFLVVAICVTWIMAFMSLMNISLNSTTGLSFGLVLIVSLSVIIRIVTHYNERYAVVKKPEEAARQALQVVFFPCFMCSVTTAVGFGSIMVTSIPMVFQLGLIMSLGVMLSFVLAAILTPAFLIWMKPLDRRKYDQMSSDWLAGLLRAVKKAIFDHYRACAAVGVVFTFVMLAGVPFVTSDTQLLRMLSESTPEVKDLRFVEQNLIPIHSLELQVESSENRFKTPESWKKVADLESTLKSVPDVVGTDSLLHLLEYLHMVTSDSDKRTDVFSEPGLVPELFAMISFSQEGKRLVSRYLDESFGRLRVSVRIGNSPDIPINETIEKIRSRAAAVMEDVGRVTVTGDTAVFAAQASGLVRSQLLSLAIAFMAITILLMIQLRSAILGLVSLIPNIPPVIMIFGVMGWLSIPLDSVTVFAATVALGLAVDDTIHYLMHLKHEISVAKQPAHLEDCMRKAFDVTAKAMLSTSLVLFFGFLVLIISPFRPVISFGILGSAAILAALLSDVVFMPSAILSSLVLKKLIAGRMNTRPLQEAAPCDHALTSHKDS
jgi:predicted RND superfamily exporter protein